MLFNWRGQAIKSQQKDCWDANHPHWSRMFPNPTCVWTAWLLGIGGWGSCDTIQAVDESLLVINTSGAPVTSIDCSTPLQLALVGKISNRDSWGGCCSTRHFSPATRSFMSQGTEGCVPDLGRISAVQWIVQPHHSHRENTKRIVQVHLSHTNKSAYFPGQGAGTCFKAIVTIFHSIAYAHIPFQCTSLLKRRQFNLVEVRVALHAGTVFAILFCDNFHHILRSQLLTIGTSTWDRFVQNLIAVVVSSGLPTVFEEQTPSIHPIHSNPPSHRIVSSHPTPSARFPPMHHCCSSPRSRWS